MSNFFLQRRKIGFGNIFFDEYYYVIDDNVKGVKLMVEKGKRILEIFGKVLPGLTDLEKKKLLAFGEGMAFMVDHRKRKDDAYKPVAQTSA